MIVLLNTERLYQFQLTILPNWCVLWDVPQHTVSREKALGSTGIRTVTLHYKKLNIESLINFVTYNYKKPQ